MNSLLFVFLVAFGSFAHFGTSEGLQNSYLTDIAKDDSGCLWMSSEAGISRFNGYSFVNFNNGNSSLSSNRINTLYHLDSKDILLVGADNGLYTIDCKTFEINYFDGINTDLLCFSQSSDGRVWAARRFGAIYLISPDLSIEEKEYANVPKNTLSLCDLGNTLAVGHDGAGLSMIDLKTGSVKRYQHDENDSNSLPGRKVYCIYKDNFNQVWIGTEHGLALYNPVTDNFITFRYDPQDPNSIISDHVYSIMELSGNKLWICTDIGGISILDLNRFHFGNNIEFENIYATYDEYGLSSRNLRKVLEDDYGNVWAVNHSSGLDCICNSPSAFHKQIYTESRLSQKNKPTSSVAVDSEGKYWVGFDNEVCCFSHDGHIEKSYVLSPYLAHSNAQVYSILIKGSDVYLGLYDSGLLKLDMRTGNINRVDIGYDVDVNGLFLDEDGSIWVGTKRGVVHLSGDSSDTILSSKEIGSIYSFARDSSGNLWVACYGGGIVVYDSKWRQVHTINKEDGLPSIVLQLCKDKNGTIWAATEKGLAMFSHPTEPERYELFGFEKGIANSYIHAIQIDYNGNVWFSSDTGISVLKHDNKSIINFSSQHGVPPSNFIDGASAMSSNGLILFGSQGGLCYFRPEEVLSPKNLSRVRIINCKYFEDGSNSPSDLLIPITNGSVNLKHKHNSFEIIFGIMDFSQTSDAEYEYCIPEIDSRWIATPSNSVSYRKLPAGKYTFKVRAHLHNSEDIETSEDVLKIIISPPFLFEWYFIILYTLLLSTVICLILRKYIRKVKIASQEELERRNSIREQELNAERLTFYTNITHELRTPLTLIIGPLEDITKSTGLPENIKKKLELVRNSAGHLLDLVNQLLEFRKSETHNRKLAVKPIYLKKLVNEIGVQFKELNTNPNVDFIVELPECDTLLLADPTVLSIILNNLLGNSAKYTKTGEICLKLLWRPESDPESALISVSDTGCGIDANDLPHIFDRFYQANDKKQASGTGIGLALAKTMAELHESSLTVESTLGVGSTFTLKIKADAKYPNAIHDVEFSNVIESRTNEPLLVEDENNQAIGDIVLVVEDNDDIRNYIASSLSDRYSVLTAENGSEGLEIAQSAIPNIIVSDIMMPQMDGLEMCTRVKNDIKTSHIPIILLTAKNTMEDQIEGYGIGADSYLTKPFSMELLITRIDNILSSRRNLIEQLLKDKSLFSLLTGSETKDDSNLSLSRIDAEFLESIHKLIEDNITSIDMQMLQDSLGLSHSTLYRKVKALTGQSVIELVKQIRLERSKKLLTEDGLNVSETAYACGFNDVGHFINSFKKEYGTTPAKIRKK